MRHPRIELLAAYAEGRLPPAEAARVGKHLVACGDCTEVVGGTIAALEGIEEPAPEGACTTCARWADECECGEAL